MEKALTGRAKALAFVGAPGVTVAWACTVCAKAYRLPPNPSFVDVAEVWAQAEYCCEQPCMKCGTITMEYVLCEKCRVAVAATVIAKRQQRSGVTLEAAPGTVGAISELLDEEPGWDEAEIVVLKHGDDDFEVLKHPGEKFAARLRREEVDVLKERQTVAVLAILDGAAQ